MYIEFPRTVDVFVEASSLVILSLVDYGLVFCFVENDFIMSRFDPDRRCRLLDIVEQHRKEIEQLLIAEIEAGHIDSERHVYLGPMPSDHPGPLDIYEQFR